MVFYKEGIGVEADHVDKVEGVAAVAPFYNILFDLKPLRSQLTRQLPMLLYNLLLLPILQLHSKALHLFFLLMPLDLLPHIFDRQFRPINLFHEIAIRSLMVDIEFVNQLRRIIVHPFEYLELQVFLGLAAALDRRSSFRF